jgi:dTDP-4-dehydrorhamnose reductase
LENPCHEVYQYATKDFASFADLAKAILDILGIKEIKICKVSSKDIPVVAPRPQQIIMESSNELVQAKFVHPYYASLEEYLSEYWANYSPTDYLIGNKS